MKQKKLLVRNYDIYWHDLNFLKINFFVYSEFFKFELLVNAENSLSKFLIILCKQVLSI